MDATTRTDQRTDQRADLCRVTVVAPKARIDVALPVDVPLADLVPTLLRRSGTDPLTDGGASGAGGAWNLQRFGDRVLDGGRTPAEHGLLDGEVLHLRPHRTRLPEPAYDDVADAVAGAVAGRTGRWTPEDTRRAAATTAGAALVVAALLAVRGGPPWSPVAVAAGAVAAVLLVGAVALSRAFGDARAGVVAAVAAVGAAALCGAAGLAGPGASGLLGAPGVVGATAAALVVAVVAVLALGTGSVALVALATAAVVGLLAAGVDVTTSAGAAGAATVAVVLALGLTPAVPVLAARLADLPQPVVPASAADVRDDRSAGVGDAVLARAVAADGYVTALVAGAALAVALGQVALAREPGTAVRWFAALAVLATLLRARALEGRRQRGPLLAAAATGVAGLAAATAAGRTGWDRLLLVGAPLVVAALVLLALAVALPGRRVSPVVRRAADLLDGVVVASLVPVALQVLGVYAYVRGLGG